jgi:hypothetical protein
MLRRKIGESEAAAGCKVLPTVAGRCVEISRRIQASHLAATSRRKTVLPPGFFDLKLPFGISVLLRATE